MRIARDSTHSFLFKPLPGCREGGCHARVWLPGNQISSSSARVAVAYHGGAWTFGDSFDIPEPEVLYLLSRGVIVVSLQYRLAPHASFSDILEDALDGYAWVWNQLGQACGLERRISQVFLLGWSAGAHVACLTAHHSEAKGLPQPSGVMVTYCPFDVNDFLRSTQSPNSEMTILNKKMELKPIEVGVPLDLYRYKPDLTRKLWYDEALRDGTLRRCLSQGEACPPMYDPILFANTSFPRCCVLAATDDTLISPRQSYDFAKHLQGLGVECLLLEAKGMRHGEAEFCQDQDRYDQWFRQCTVSGLDWLLR